ncbi:MAG: TIGR01212 family radical SAM protein [Bacteroidales bacterium]|nr:TIGR01212 family radical SAM protein [Bacteroidales bacterium]MBN2749068.1 TIGR01212 family radical SAM protein [Bacteroidales bacterium]
MFPWGDTRRFNSYSGYFKRIFGGRIQKLTIDAGFSCPNRDGSLSVGGCTFCNNDAFNPSYCESVKSITQQIEEGIEFHAVRYRRADRYLAYFQAYSNTHAPLERLKQIYDEALAHPRVIGVVIGTRPDCVDADKLNYIQSLAQKHYVAVEYGLESTYNSTLERINRGHSYEKSVWAIQETAKRGIKVGAHIIFGLPGETREMMMSQAQTLSQLPLDTIKFHQLQIIKGTIMEQEYLQNPNEFKLFAMDEYLDFMADFLERFNPNIVVERFTGEAPPRFLATPSWGRLRTDQVLQLFEKRLLERDTYQGRLWKG